MVPLVLLLACGSGCGRISSAAPHAPEASAEPTAVATVHPEQRTLQRLVDQPGQIEGMQTAWLYAKISGYIQELKADIGDHVREGQVLAVLSVPEMAKELEQKAAGIQQAEQALAVAQATVLKMQAGTRLSRATLARAEASLVRWKAQYERDRRLVASRTVDQEQLEQSTDQFHSAEAAKGEANAAVQAAEAAEAESAAHVKKAEADIAVAQADHDRLAALYSYREVHAPFDGVITRRDINVEKGHLLQPTGAQASNGLPLFQIARIDPVRVFIDVPEFDAPLVRDGSIMRVTVPALGEREFDGTVARTGFALESMARTLRVQLDVANPKGELRPGMYAKARLLAERPKVLTVPASALFVRDDQSYVVVIEAGKAHWLPVRIGQRGGRSVEVLRKQAQPAGADGRHSWEPFTGSEEIVETDPTAIAEGQVVRPVVHEGTVAQAEAGR